MKVAYMGSLKLDATDETLSDPIDWQSNLVGLLCRLEEYRAEMGRHRLIAGASELIRLSKMMLRECEAISVQAPWQNRNISLQMQTMARSGRFFATANALQPSETRGMMRSLLSRIMGEPTRQTASSVQDCLLDAHEAVQSYFALFASQFETPVASRSWSDAAEAFETEFKEMICILPA